MGELKRGDKVVCSKFETFPWATWTDNKLQFVGKVGTVMEVINSFVAMVSFGPTNHDTLRWPLKNINHTVKTATIHLDSIKDSDGWWQLGTELGASEEKMDEYFKWGEYASLEIVVDENFNIVGGKIIPLK